MICLRFLQAGYTDNECEKDDKALVFSSLCRASQQKWVELTTRSHQKGGIEMLPVERLKVGVPATFDKQDKVVVLRFNKAGRLIGFRRDRIYHIVWVDPTHSCYDG